MANPVQKRRRININNQVEESKEVFDKEVEKLEVKEEVKDEIKKVVKKSRFGFWMG